MCRDRPPTRVLALAFWLARPSTRRREAINRRRAPACRSCSRRDERDPKNRRAGGSGCTRILDPRQKSPHMSQKIALSPWALSVVKSPQRRMALRPRAESPAASVAIDSANEAEARRIEAGRCVRHGRPGRDNNRRHSTSQASSRQTQGERLRKMCGGKGSLRARVPSALGPAVEG